MKFFNFNKNTAKPLDPVVAPNGFLGKGNLAPFVPSAKHPKSKFLEGFSSAIGSLGKGLSGSGQSDNFTPSPIQVQNTNRIISNPVDIPQVPQMPTIQQTALPTGKADYNPLFELQKLIERQRAGY